MITLLYMVFGGYISLWLLQFAFKPTPKTKIDELIEMLKED